MSVQVLEQILCLFAAIGFQNLEFQFFQDVDDQHAHDGIVFDDKDGGGVGG
ncbi:hypothetical protein D9M73_239250 [compost metagenome]